MRRPWFITLLAMLPCAGDLAAADPLPSWNDTASKQAILAFVERVTQPGSPDYVPEAERVAVFDNDGTLWAEQPLYFQVRFALDQVKALAPQHPEWKQKQPFKRLLSTPQNQQVAVTEPELLEIVMATHAGMTTEEFALIVKEWIGQARHPGTGRLYTEMVYQPMLELLACLRAHGFKTYIASGGGIEFMRVFSEQLYGIPPEQVIGSSIKSKFEMRDGQPVLVRLAEVNFIDDKEGKPVGIHQHIGRRPLAAFGNSDGDLAMLQWTAARAGASFCLYVHHTDAEREWAYDRDSHIGRLDQGLAVARTHGWTVVDMKRDWKEIFPPAPAAGKKAPPKEVPSSARWAGDYPVAALKFLPEGQREGPVGFIGDAQDFASVWKAFQPGQPVPSVEFMANFVVFTRNTQFYNRTSIAQTALTDGVLTVLAMETKSALPIEEKVAMAMAVVPRQGIRAIQCGDRQIPLGAD